MYEIVKPRYTNDGRGMLRRDGGVYVLHVSGSEKEMARQHGELLAAEIGQGMVPFASKILKIKSPDPSMVSGLLARIFQFGLGLVTRRLISNLPAWYRNVCQALADTSGIDRHTFEMACTTPDALMLTCADPKRYRAHLVRGWCSDLRNNRGEALSHYERARRASLDIEQAQVEIDIWLKRRFKHRHRRSFFLEMYNVKRIIQ